MAYSDNVITAPVRMVDLQSALSSGSTDLGTLCRSNNINMWAKYKPVVRRNLIDTTGQLAAGNVWKTSAAIEAGGHQNESWWKGDDTNHGLTPYFQTASWSPAGFISALNALVESGRIDGDKNGWTYTRPSGGTASPYRMIDFNQYNHKAPNPIKASRGIENIYAAITQAWTYSFSLMEVEPEAYDNRNYIVPTDLKIDGTLNQTLYIGLAIFKKSGSTYSAMAWCNGNEWNGSGILNSDQSDGVDTSGSYNAVAKFKDGGTYYALPVYFTRNDLTQQYNGQSYVGGGSGCKIITVPYVNFMAFTTNQRSTIQTIGLPNLSNKQVTKLYKFSTSLYLDSREDGYSGGTASTVRMVIVNELWNGTSSAGTYAFDNTWNNVVVGSSENHLVGSTGTLTLDGSHTWRAIVWVNGGSEVTINLIQPQPLTPV